LSAICSACFWRPFGYNPHLEFAPRALDDLQRLGGLSFDDVEQLPAVSGELETWEERLIFDELSEAVWET
jgi:hypothetical protein